MLSVMHVRFIIDAPAQSRSVFLAMQRASGWNTQAENILRLAVIRLTDQRNSISSNESRLPKLSKLTRPQLAVTSGWLYSVSVRVEKCNLALRALSDPL